MSSTQSVAIAATVLTACLALAVVPAHAEPLTCQGRVVTIAGNIGTDGDDVMVVTPPTPSGAPTASSGPGNDLVCIRIASGDLFSFTVDAGPGDDRVVNESTDGNVLLVTLLGAGADTYVGNHTSETVVAGAATFSRLGDTSDVDADTIITAEGNDKVSSGSVAPGAHNPDVVALGLGDDTLEWAGEQSGGKADLGPGQNTLAFYPGWLGTEVNVDAPRSLVSVDARPTFWWTGTASRFRLAVDNLHTTFTGTDAGERLELTSGIDHPPNHAVPPPNPDLRHTVDMQGGDDLVELWDVVDGSLVGGEGRDTLQSGSCFVANVRLGGVYSCLRSYSPLVQSNVTIDAWEALRVTGHQVTVLGTEGPDTIDARGFSVRVNGRGGRDLLSASARWAMTTEPTPPVVLKGGGGADTIVGSFLSDRLLGGPGRDRIHGSGGPDRIFGGPGHDRLKGDKGTDRIFGGPGRDRAIGGSGRDRCVAEVRRSCER